MKYTQIPSTAFENIQLNAGILVDNFNPATGVIGRILGATSGGANFTDSITYKDFGEDIDNCPKNMLELKKVDSREVKLAGTFVTVDATTAKDLIGASDVDALDATHIIPRNDLYNTDFKTLWWVGDYSNVNTGAGAGFIAIKLMNALNTGGFQIQSADKDKGKFAFEFLGHYSMAEQNKVPYEVYIKAGNEEPTPVVNLDAHSVMIEKGGTHTLTATTVPADAVVTWATSSSVVADVVDGLVSGEDTGNAIITASITVDGVTYNDTCTVIVTE